MCGEAGQTFPVTSRLFANRISSRHLPYYETIAAVVLRARTTGNLRPIHEVNERVVLVRNMF